MFEKHFQHKTEISVYRFKASNQEHELLFDVEHRPIYVSAKQLNLSRKHGYRSRQIYNYHWL